MAISSRITLHILLLCCYGPLFVHSALTVLPLNDAVLVGSTVVLRCSVAAGPSNSRVLWTEFASNSNGVIVSDEKWIIWSHPEADRFSIVGGELDYHLQIRDVRLTDAGTYSCQDINAVPPSTYRGYAELAVLEGDPQCQDSVPIEGVVFEGVRYSSECEVGYRSNIPPVMNWTGPGEFITNVSTTPDSVLAWKTFEAERSIEGEVFTCHTKFPVINADPGHANNTPTYTHTYTSPIMLVRWGPKNVYAEPIKKEYAVGDVITCYADANPPPEYTWRNMRTKQSFKSQTFTITQDLNGYNQTMRCQAENLINGTLYVEYFYTNVFIPMILPPGKPENMYAEPIKEEYAVGDVITCYADADPLPSYQWMNLRTYESIYSQTFTIPRDWVGFNDTMRCQAVNVINGTVCVGNFFTSVYVPGKPQNMYAEPIKEEYTVGDVITCNAAANPLPTYHWLNMRTYETFSSQTFRITQDLVGFNQTMRCQAQNLINGTLNVENFYTPVYVPGNPQNMYAEPIKEEYTVGDVITCTADANPLPSYQWLNMRTYEMFSSQTFTITQDLFGFNQTMMCQAQNLINGTLYTAQFFTPVYVSGKPQNMYAEPIKEGYTVGDVITCTAVANPLPYYQWLNMRTYEMFSSQTFTITQDLVGFNQTMRCQAQNLINGTLYTAQFFTPVYVPDMD